MPFFTQFYVCCRNCGRRNLPHNSPKKGMRLALTGQLQPCRHCGQEFGTIELPDRPLVQRVREELKAEGIPTVC